MDLFIGIFLGVFVLVCLVVVHELGHAIAALRNGVVVEEFGVGFPPVGLKKKLRNGILLTLNWLPLGGYVKLQGEYDAANKSGDYGAASFWAKTKILLAGVTANWIVGAVLLTVLALVGMPKVISNQFSVPGDTTITSQHVEISAVLSGYPADKAGLRTGDKIIRYAGSPVASASELISVSKKNAGKKIDVIYERRGEENTAIVNLKKSDADGSLLGASLGQRDLIKATWSAPIVGVATTAQFTWLTLQSVGQMFGDLVNGVFSQFSTDNAVREKANNDLKKVGDSVSGPVGILGTIFPSARQDGPVQVTFLAAIISISLAVMNILPIPALDGGRWLTMVGFRVAKKKLTRKLEEKIQSAGFMIIMVLVVLVTIADVSKIL